MRAAPVILIALALYFSAVSAIRRNNSGVISPQGICGAMANVSLSRWGMAPFSPSLSIVVLLFIDQYIKRRSYEQFLFKSNISTQDLPSQDLGRFGQSKRK
jgi:hypothetical protein